MVPTWTEIGVGAVLALGILALGIALAVVPPPWTW